MSRFPDLEALAVAYLGVALGVRVSTNLPARLVESMPVVRVTRGPGSDDRFTDSPLLDVECFAATRQDAYSLAEDTRAAMHALRGKAVNGALVDSVTTATGPVWVDYENEAVKRYVASYRVDLRAT